MITYLEKHFSRIWFMVFSIDFLILLFTAAIALKIINRISSFYIVDLRYIHLIISFPLISQVALFINELYITEKRYSIKSLVVKCIVSFIIASMGCYILFINRLSYFNCFLLSMVACGLILSWRFLFYRAVGKVNIQDKILFLGINELSKMVVKEVLADDYPKFKIIGFISNDPALVGKNIGIPKVLGLVKDLNYITEKEKIKKVIVSWPQGIEKFPAEYLINCKFKGVEILDIHTFYEHLKGKILLNGLRPAWLIFTDGFTKNKLIELRKRIIDIVFSFIGLLVTSPISIITALLIKLESEGPIIYRQERVGENGRIFTLFKFRSMKIDAEEHTGPVWADKNDQRTTRIGKFIRKVRIDEIPQIFNVLKGDMSFIGPRPERPFFVEKLKQIIPYYDQRHSVKPGITGWAAVNYSYGANIEDAIEKLQYDFYYIKNMSLFLDSIIILKTLTTIFTHKGAR
ncbi:MAG: TIGR03013 family XrtA/PEP-CTERM system glycosyltransferase [bacterium]